VLLERLVQLVMAQQAQLEFKVSKVLQELAQLDFLELLAQQG
jgi:hypothetical protein